MLLWLLVWVLLLASAAPVLFLSGRMLWRKGLALVEELGEASERLSPALDRLDTAAQDRPAPDLAVFADPAVLRRARDTARGRAPDGGRARRPRAARSRSDRG